MDFTASLDYLYGLQRFGIKLGLENMQAIKSRLPLLQEPLPCIHVAGTNGKGSVSIMLAEILRHSGLRVGCGKGVAQHEVTVIQRLARGKGYRLAPHIACDFQLMSLAANRRIRNG